MTKKHLIYVIRRKAYPSLSSPDSDEYAAKIHKRSEYKEDFSVSLSYNHVRIRDKINAIHKVMAYGSAAIELYLKDQMDIHNSKIAQLNHDEKTEYNNYISAAKNLINDSQAKPLHIHSKKVARLIEVETEMYTLRENVRRASMEMILVYLVIVFEEYITNILTALFRRRPSILKSSKKSITYEEAFKHRNLSELLTAIGRVEVESRTGSDIEDFGKYLRDMFNFEIMDRQDWKQFKEYFYRRNIIVHNSGYPDSLYFEKTGYKVPKNGVVDWLEVDKNYLHGALNMFETYSDEIRQLFYNKYAKGKIKSKGKK